MSEVKWIKISTDLFDDEKINYIGSLPEADAIIIIWIHLLILAGKCNANGYVFLAEGMLYTPEMLAHKFRMSINITKLALHTFVMLKMIEINENGIYILNWIKYQNIDGLDKIREQGRNRIAKYRNRQKLLQSGEASSNVSCNVTVTGSNRADIESEKSEEKNRSISNNPVEEILKNVEIDTFTNEAQELIKVCIDDMYFNNGFTQSVGIPDESIRSRLKKLNSQMVRTVLVKCDYIFQENQQISNKVLYFQKCLWNVLAEATLSKVYHPDG
jgi:predicted phage replisome organizer